MKLSVEMMQNDPKISELCNNVDIRLNGEIVKYCTECDDEAGYIVQFVTDADGNFVREGDELKTERLEGKVEIVDRRKRMTLRA